MLIENIKKHYKQKCFIIGEVNVIKQDIKLC